MVQLLALLTHSCRIKGMSKPYSPNPNLPVQAQYQALYPAPAQFPVSPQIETSEQPPPGVEPEPSSEPTSELVRQVVQLAQPVAQPEELHAPEIDAQQVAAAVGITGKIMRSLWIIQIIVNALQRIVHRLAVVRC